jgi:large subunit ribosomal protein L10
MAEKTKPKIKANVSPRKKEVVKELAKLLARKTIMIVSIKNIACSQFQQIKKKLRGKAEMRVSKKNLVKFAIEHAKDEKLKELISHLNENYALLFSDEDAFELSAFLADNKSSTRARLGQIAEEDIPVEAGPTELMPGPDISFLSSVGLRVKVENGKIAITENKILVKKGEAIPAEKVSVLGKLGITPFRIGLEPLVAYSEGKIYTSIKVNKEEVLNDLKQKFARCIAFAVSLVYATKETLPFILGKAVSHEKAIAALIKNESETKQEAPAESPATPAAT